MKRFFLILSLAMCSFTAAMADNQAADAVYAWVDGSYTCYRLTDMPKVSYQGNNAVLTLAGQSTPELVVPLNGSQLKITYGIYEGETDLQNTQEMQPVHQVHKIIRGGRLIIIRDGKQYDAQGGRIE